MPYRTTTLVALLLSAPAHLIRAELCNWGTAGNGRCEDMGMNTYCVCHTPPGWLSAHDVQDPTPEFADGCGSNDSAQPA
ncbi:hypothetical protein Tdes44962_MAKER10039 [Teratosphaeria destructans]|uniref:Extracellular membrane protein CFEM domain-containing protein n=1 Tax=Teratosphaeria destructans TaxID=418781 RepID=A0A9W7W1K3_9PEZI|nr:hypothetical protein Tdes44962_MAKER10039 [Teratosphaeria destructans]